MESEDEWKESDIKNHICYRFDDLMKANDIYSKNILLDENHCLFVSKPLPICFDRIYGFIKIYDGIRYLVILDHSWFDEICDTIKHLISENSGIMYGIYDNFARPHIDS